ncbi:MAG: hypothetical protein M5U28_55840, partial [Sandaracinaceae bacterium]|nr:hypothetical protein [Sandaracinaceae bacterium]
MDAAGALELLVRDRDPSADDAELAAARHFLAMALHRMGQPLRPSPSSRRASEARGESGPFLATLPWLVRIAARCPSPTSHGWRATPTCCPRRRWSLVSCY